MAKASESAVQPEQTTPETPETQQGAANKAPGYFKVEEMAAKAGTSASIHIGTCAAMGWQHGKMVTEAEYAKAVKSFSSAPMGGNG